MNENVIEFEKPNDKTRKIVHTCGACRKVLKEGDNVKIAMLASLTPQGAVPLPIMVCSNCGVLSITPEGVNIASQEKNRIVIPH